MKKVTRIFAVVMTACLLFGAVTSIFVSAKIGGNHEGIVVKYADGDVTTRDAITATNANSYSSDWDFPAKAALTKTKIVSADGTKTDENYYDAFGENTVNAKLKSPKLVNDGRKGYNYPVLTQHVYDEVSGEGYLAIRKMAGETIPVAVAHAESQTGAAVKDQAVDIRLLLGRNFSFGTVNRTAYTVFDFDFGTDRWAYKIDGEWHTSEVVPAGATDVTPAYRTGDIFISHLDTVSGTDTPYVPFVWKCAYDADGYYVYIDGVESTKTYLTNQPGILDHFTYLYETQKDTLGKLVGVKIHAFLNGKYMHTVTKETIAFRIEYLGIKPDLNTVDGNGKYAREQDCYSLVIDNNSHNYYRNDHAPNEFNPNLGNYDYTFAESKDGYYGLDDYMTEEHYKTVPLYKCLDVFYNSERYPSVDDSVITVDGTMYKTLTTELGSFRAIKNNSKLTLPAGKSYTLYPQESVEAFSVTLGEGAKINLVETSFKFELTDAQTNTYSASKLVSKASISLMLKMSYNFYVPASTNVYTFDGENVSDPVNATIGGVDYKQFVWTPEIDSFETNVITLYYDEAKSVSCSITLDVVAYLGGVADEYVCGTAASTLAYETMNYKATIAKYSDSSFSINDIPAVKSFFEKYDSHASGCTCKDTCKTGIPSDSVSKGTLQGLRVAYMLDISEAGLIIDGAGATDALTVAYNNGSQNVTLSVGHGIRREVFENSVYYVVDGISIENISSVLTITNGTQSGTYSLYAHIQALTAAEKTDAASVASSLYAYSVAAKAYVNSLAAN